MIDSRDRDGHPLYVGDYVLVPCQITGIYIGGVGSLVTLLCEQPVTGDKERRTAFVLDSKQVVLK